MEDLEMEDLERDWTWHLMVEHLEVRHVIPFAMLTLFSFFLAGFVWVCRNQNQNEPAAGAKSEQVVREPGKIEWSPRSLAGQKSD
jgi:hypothetical protein